jgi:3-hydroxyisobutyrate dehydrogenase-like beta-hydroxyacid dehydrogenase
MRVVIVGLGRMGMNMAKRLLQGGHKVVAYNRISPKKVSAPVIALSLREDRPAGSPCLRYTP